MKISTVFSRQKKQTSQSQRRSITPFLEDLEARDKVCLNVTIPVTEAENINKLLKEKGLSQKNGIPLLIQYGLSDETEEELEKLRLEKNSKAGYSLTSRSAAMHFQTYQYFMENKRLTIKLNIMLSENRSMKKRLENEDLQNRVPKDEWDNWDKARVDEFYRKYVFMNQS